MPPKKATRKARAKKRAPPRRTAKRRPARRRLCLSKLNAAELLALLAAGGSRFASRETVAADSSAGAPVNPDGSFDFLALMAWGIRESRDGGGRKNPEIG